MSNVLNIEELTRSLRKGNKFEHKKDKKIVLLPFTTREPERPKYKNGFKAIVGEFSRIIANVKIDGDQDIKDIIEEICQKVSIQDEADKKEFRRIVESYLLDENHNVKVTSPGWFCLLPLSKNKEQLGERKTGKFLSDVLLTGEVSNRLLRESPSADSNILTKLIDSSLHYQKLDGERQREYHSLLPYVSETFTEDFEWLETQPKLFIQHYEKLLYYYFFFYISQLGLKLNQFTKADYTAVTPVYYTLDWEKTSRRRKGYEFGWNMIKEVGTDILVHVYTLEQLNYFDNPDSPLSYVGLDQHISDPDAFSQSVSQWIDIYKSNFMDIISQQEWDKLNLSDEKTVEAMVQNLYKTILYQFKNNDYSSLSRYQRWFEQTVSLYLSKPRGQLGRMLNINQDFLMFLTLVSLKNKKAPLKELFKEFEKRGVYFDQFSQQEIIELFDRLNLLEKKSDSGDAQYVKPIL
ncbi:DNA phosphorothioation-dependent restriction protein DptG [Bacillus fengqiuensis]|nr:DNA phosphorothioation-dependent restriction protein DptG [Bacillus fengqiuensis]